MRCETLNIGNSQGDLLRSAATITTASRFFWARSIMSDGSGGFQQAVAEPSGAIMASLHPLYLTDKSLSQWEGRRGPPDRRATA